MSEDTPLNLATMDDIHNELKRRPNAEWFILHRPTGEDWRYDFSNVGNGFEFARVLNRIVGVLVTSAAEYYTGGSNSK